MKYKGRPGSSNVNDLRGRSGGGGRIPIPMGRGGIGCGGLILLILIALLRGGLGIGGPATSQTPPTETRTEQSQSASGGKDELMEFSSVVLADTERVWTEVFEKNGRTYHPPQMNVFTGSVQSGCGYASAQTGPFYCPADQSIYLDLSFYDDLHQRFGAKGDYAFNYVIAHEVGHHVQRELGVMGQVQELQQKVSKKDANRLSVAQELQADYLAGVVAKHQEQYGYLDEGDIEEAMTATQAIGDDTLQKRGQGYVVPDSFTHGTSEQRTEWFMRGYRAGDLSDWDTFKELGL